MTGILHTNNFHIYHGAAEIFSIFIAFGIFIVAINTYKISKNEFFKLLGVGYIFVGLLDLMHTFSYSDINIFLNASFSLATQFWVSARVFELGVIILSTFILYQKIKKPNYFLILPILVAVFTLFIYGIMYTEILPEFRIEGIGLTQLRKIIGYLISLGFIVSILIIYKARKIMDKDLFIYLECSLILKVIYEMIFTLFTYNTDFYFIAGHILKIISYYFMYKGIIVNGLQRPYDNLIYNLDKADIKLKESKLQHKYMEEAIFKNEQCYDLIINQSKDGILIHTDGKYIFANSTALNILGVHDVVDLIGREILDIVHEDYLVQSKQRLNMIMDNKSMSILPPIELQLTSIDGKIIDIECSTSNIIYRGKASFLILFSDISAQKRIATLNNDIKESEEKLNQSNEYNKVLTEFFSNISHELRTPINVISSANQLMMLTSNNELPSLSEEKQKSLMHIIKQNTYRLIRLVNNILDTSKFDSGYLKLNLQNHNIVSVVEDITLSVIDYVKSKGVKITFDTDIEEKIMEIDDDKIERIILNLLSNAIKFTNIGDEIIVRIEDMDKYIRISVKDTGIGIPEDKLNLIFNRFDQVDKTFTRNKEGSGIGLSLVKTLTEMHGGNIKVNSKLGEGSEFIVELPVSVSEDEDAIYAITSDNKVEKINIEFSDIYNND